MQTEKESTTSKRNLMESPFRIGSGENYSLSMMKPENFCKFTKKYLQHLLQFSLYNALIQLPVFTILYHCYLERLRQIRKIESNNTAVSINLKA